MPNEITAALRDLMLNPMKQIRSSVGLLALSVSRANIVRVRKLAAMKCADSAVRAPDFATWKQRHLK
jgi:hypothetical protein